MERTNIPTKDEDSASGSFDFRHEEAGLQRKQGMTGGMKIRKIAKNGPERGKYE